MSEVPPDNMRERKKVATRLAIRRQAFRLFEEQGFAATTVEQISNAADVSSRTFYRYFAVKEAVLLSDDHIPPIVDAFISAPPELNPVAAYRYAVRSVYSTLTEEERQDAITGQRLMYAVPEANGLLYTAYTRLIDQISDALESRLDNASPLERRVVAGAIVGVLMAMSDHNPHPADALDDGLALLDTEFFGGSHH